MAIHERAIVDPGAQIAADVEIGPWSVIGPDVTIGAGSVIGPNVIIAGRTTIGENNHIYQFSSVGDDPQDKKYRDEPTRLEIGDNNTIREYCTISRGTVQDESLTRIGNDNWIMAYVHIAHDCVVGDFVTLAPRASINGNVHVADHAYIGTGAVLKQGRPGSPLVIGEGAVVGMGAVVTKNVAPNTTVVGNPARVLAP